MNNNIDLKKTEKMGYINFWCQKVIPLVFDDSLSYYEAICKFMQKLNEVISALNNNAECIDELQGKYIILQRNFDALEVKWEEFKTYIENKFNTFKTEITTKEENFETTINNEFNSFKNYVENYLNNIDVQSYVNIKIDELAESGYFSTLLTNLGFNPDNYLAKNNTTVYVPTNDYNPATKKYVDEHSSQGTVYSAGDGIKIENDTISSENSNIKNSSALPISNPPSNDGVYVNSSTFIAGYNSLNLVSKPTGKVKILGDENRWGNGGSNGNPIVIGNKNNISGDGINRNIIIGNQNTIGHNSKANNGIFIGRNITYKEDYADNNFPIVIANPETKGENAIEIIDNWIKINTYIDFNNDITLIGNLNGKGTIFAFGINDVGDDFTAITPYLDSPDYQDRCVPMKAFSGDIGVKNLLLNANKVNRFFDEYDKQLICVITYENNVTGNTRLILRNGFYFLNMSVTYPSSITGNDSTLTLFRINITSSDTKINGFKNFNAIIVNKNDTSSKERTAPIRVVKLNDTEYSIVYVGNETENKPYNYTIEFGGVIGYL